jgi:pimeloyl-ACP methyl ester carboxylesterase
VMRDLGLRRPIVLGHSWGANVALELGVREPAMVSGLILLDGGFSSMRERMDWKTAKQMLTPPSIAGMHVDQYVEMVRRFMPPDMEITTEVEAVFRSLMRVDGEGRIRPRLSRANHLKILRAMWEQDALELLRRVTVPTLAVGTRRETTEESEKMFIAAKEASAEEVREIGGRVQFEWIDGIHDVPLQRPDAVADLVRRFASELP